MRFQEKRIQFGQQFSGNIESANKAVKALALLINFMPYEPRTLHNYSANQFLSPFERINGFRYRDDWLENLLVASSLNGNWNQ